jgi:two-component system, LytTR family, response regulator
VSYRALIVDDERLARERIRRLLAHEADFTVTGESATSQDALRAIHRDDPDVVFLDVEMPGGDAFDLLRRLEGPLPRIVFVTAHDDYAVAAFEVEAFDYLLKPFDGERFRKTLDRVRKRLGGEGGDESRETRESLDRLLAARERRFLARIPVTSDGRTRFIEVDSIDWIEAEDNYVQIHAGGARHVLRETLAGIAKKLDPDHFVRVHRSGLVNAAAVREVRTLFHGDLELVLRGGAAVRVGRSYRSGLKERIGRG